MKVPGEIRRKLRSLSTVHYWKASEFCSFLLFYSLPSLSGIPPAKYRNHWFLLVQGMYLLLQSEVTEEERLQAEKCLKNFVIYAVPLYGQEYITYNMHLLTHLARAVELYGPLWSVSAFPFESHNGALKNSFNGTQHVPAQICKRNLMKREMAVKSEEVMKSMNSTLVEMFSDLIAENHFSVAKTTAFGNITAFGKGSTPTLSHEEKLAIKSFQSTLQDVSGEIVSPSRYVQFLHFLVGKLHISCKVRAHTDDTFCVLQNGKFVKVHRLIILQPSGTPLLMVSVLKTRHVSIVHSDINVKCTMLHVIEGQEPTRAILANELWNKGMRLSTCEEEFLCCLPNFYEKD